MVKRNELLSDTKFKIDHDAEINIFRVPIISYKFSKVKLGKLRRNEGLKYIPIKDTCVYQYLKAGEKLENSYKEYCQLNNVDKKNRSVELFRDLQKSIFYDNYDEKKGVIVIDQHKCIVDGQHRAACLISQYGENYYVNMLQLRYLYRTPRGYLMDFFFWIDSMRRKNEE